MLSTWPYRSSRVAKSARARTMSRTWQKQRCCCPGSVYGDRLVGQRLAYERGQDHPVAAGLARPDRVEQAPHHDRQLALAVVGDRQELVERLGARIRPAAARGRTHHDVAVLDEGKLRRLAVDLAGRSDEHRLVLLVRLREHDLGAVNVGLERADGTVDDQLHADGGGEVEDVVGVVDKLSDDAVVVAGVDRVAEPGAARRCRILAIDPVDRSSRA